jgi:hypothetical protein
MIQSRDDAVTFERPFKLKAVDRELPAGTYRLSIDEETIEQLSFPVRRRLATMIFVKGPRALEMWTIDPQDLDEALHRERVAKSQHREE